MTRQTCALVLVGDRQGHLGAVDARALEHVAAVGDDPVVNTGRGNDCVTAIAFRMGGSICGPLDVYRSREEPQEPRLR